MAERLGEQSKVTLENLGFTYKDEVGLINITEVPKAHVVPTEAFHVPRKTS